MMNNSNAINLRAMSMAMWSTYARRILQQKLYIIPMAIGNYFLTKI